MLYVALSHSLVAFFADVRYGLKWVDTCCIDKTSSADRPSPSTRCFVGTKRLRSAMYIYQMSIAPPFEMTGVTRLRGANGSLGDGLCRSSLLQEMSASTIHHGSILGTS